VTTLVASARVDHTRHLTKQQTYPFIKRPKPKPWLQLFLKKRPKPTDSVNSGTVTTLNVLHSNSIKPGKAKDSVAGKGQCGSQQTSAVKSLPYDIHQNKVPAETMRLSFKYATASRTVDILSSCEWATQLDGRTLLSCINSSASALRRQRAASRDTWRRFSEYLRLNITQTNHQTGTNFTRCGLLATHNPLPCWLHTYGTGRCRHVVNNTFCQIKTSCCHHMNI